MWERIRTALVLLVIVGMAMFASTSPVPILSLLLVMGGIGAYEWAKMLPSLQQPIEQVLSASKDPIQTPPPLAKKFHYVFAMIVLALMMLSLALPMTWVFWWGLASILWLFVVRWVGNFPEKTENWYGKRLIAIAVIMLVSAITAMYFLWQQSAWWLLYVFVLVWCADSGAYFVGLKLGKRKMSPAVSPNKSVEGLYGGLATGVLVVLGVSFGVLNSWSGMAIVLFLGLSLITIVMSVFGDLFESMMKRHAGIKDSGRILPGHGGVLDRIDSQLSAMPIFALGFWALQHFQFIA